MDKHRLARSIDHTLLKPAALEKDFLRLCAEAVEHQFYSVCIPTVWVATARQVLQGSNVKIVTVAAFPTGASSTKIKCLEVEESVRLGADEIDFVQNIGWLKERSLGKLGAELASLSAAAGSVPLKVIIETALLTDEEKTIACKLAVDNGIAFVKTCTGFMGGGATVADVALMKNAVGQKGKVKASGGIKDAAAAWQLLEAGADRLGTSASVLIMQEI